MFSTPSRFLGCDGLEMVFHAERVGACLLVLFCSNQSVLVTAVSAETPRETLWQKSNLVAWCLVPFDSAKRGPAERAEMLNRLGIRRVAYDWREEHVGTFEEEILQYQKYNLDFFAFWNWHPSLEPLILKYGIHPQIWITNPSPEGDTDAEKVQAAVNALLPLVNKTAELQLKLGLYNHGGWGGEPVNLIAVCEHLQQDHQAKHVGIVYNFHHGHGHIDDFAAVLALMQPYLLCLNLNGMQSAEEVSRGANKILPIGSGLHEASMLRSVLESQYDGPIGILDHRPTIDAEQSLRENLDGLRKVTANLVTSPE